MCRFVCYLGPEMLLEDLIYRPTNSLILQSYKARERKEPLNGDGFGIGWYSPKLASEPCVFTSVTPAWSNQNLRRLAGHVKSPCFFGHVRAASPGLRVGDENCHPFVSGSFLWMHNGSVGGFARIKRRLRASLPDDLYAGIQGTTDSEHAFALFLSLLPTGRPLTVEDFGATLRGTIHQLEAWRAETGGDEPSLLNFAVTDGTCIAATRYTSDPEREPITLYIACGKKYVCEGNAAKLVCADPDDCAAVVASERLTDDPGDWKAVPPNHLLTAAPGPGVALTPV